MEAKKIGMAAVCILIGLGLLYFFATIFPAPTLVANLLLVVMLVTEIVLIGFGGEHASGRKIPMPRWLRSTITAIVYFVMGLVLVIGCGGLVVYLTFINPIPGAMAWVIVLLGLGCLTGLFCYMKH